MALQMSCECGEKFNVETTQRGTIVRCPACSNGVKVPDDRGGKPAPRPVLAEVEPEEDDPRIVFDCPKCGNAMKARVSYAGRSTLCPKCQASVTIPDKETRHSRPAKKSPVGLFIGLGVGLLLLIGGIIVAVMLMKKDGPGGGFAKADIDDLSLVPANAQGLVCLKAATLWQTAAVQKAVEDYRRDNPGKPDLVKRLETETGLKPEEIERVTRVITDASKEEGWTIIKTKKPYDAKALTGRVRNSQSKSHLDSPYVVGVDSQDQPVALAPVSPSVFVVGKEEGVRQALGLIATPIAKGNLAPVIEMCRKDDHVVFGYNAGAGRVEGNKNGFDLSKLNDMELLTGTVNVREQTELNARARADSDEKAEKIRGITAGWIRGIQTLLAVEVKLGQLFPNARTEQAKRESKLLKAVKLSAEGNEVVVTMKADTDLVLPHLLGMLQ